MNERSRTSERPGMSERPRSNTAKNLVTPGSLGYRMPAEWEQHTATWLAWPHHRTDWPGKLAAIPWVFAEVARHLTRGERVRLLVDSKLERQKAERVFERAGVELGSVDFVLAATNRSWTRDYLPLFVTLGAATDPEVPGDQKIDGYWMGLSKRSLQVA